MGQSFKVDGQDMRLSVSIGLALIPSSERSVDDWINAAFAAARTAHRLGGNRVEGILSDADSALPPERLLRIRELLPFSQRSAVWRGLRALWRRIRTQKAQEDTLSARDQAAFDALRQEFAPAYADLAARYSLAPAAAPKARVA